MSLVTWVDQSITKINILDRYRDDKAGSPEREKERAMFFPSQLILSNWGSGNMNGRQNFILVIEVECLCGITDLFWKAEI